MDYFLVCGAPFHDVFRCDCCREFLSSFPFYMTDGIDRYCPDCSLGLEILTEID